MTRRGKQQRKIPEIKKVKTTQSGIVLDMQNETSKFTKLGIADIINSIIAFLTLLSVIFVGIGLNQNRIAQDNLYRPWIVLDVMNISVNWDTEGNPSWINLDVERDNFQDPSYDKNSDTYTITYNFTYQLVEGIHNFAVRNIGVGTAKNIRLFWVPNNTDRLNQYLIEIDEKYETFMQKGDASTIFTYNDYNVMVDNEKTTGFSYLLPDAESEVEITLPAQYSILLSEIMRNPKLNTEADYPVIFCVVLYEDIQGIEYTQSYELRITNVYKNLDTDGSGNSQFALFSVDSK